MKNGTGVQVEISVNQLWTPESEATAPESGATADSDVAQDSGATADSDVS